MPKQVLSKQEQQLAEQLRREAIESRPAFSESLHRRILSAIEQQRTAETQAAERVPLLRSSGEAQGRAPEHCLCQAVAHHGSDHPLTQSRHWPRVLAAACLLCAVGTGWVALRQNAVEKPSLTQLPSVRDLTDHTVGRFDDLTVAAVLEPQTTPLKNDARAVAGVFLDRLPIPVKMVGNR